MQGNRDHDSLTRNFFLLMRQRAIAMMISKLEQVVEIALPFIDLA